MKLGNFKIPLAVLLALLAIRFIAQLLGVFGNFAVVSIAFAVLYAAAFAAVFRGMKLGYPLAMAVAVIDIIARLVFFSTAANVIGAVIIDIVIAGLAYFEWQSSGMRGFRFKLAKRKKAKKERPPKEADVQPEKADAQPDESV